MKTNLIAAVVTAFAFALTASAGTVPIPRENPIATVNFPEKWKIKLGEFSIDAVSDDDDVNIYITAHDAATIDKAIEDTAAYLAGQKVKIKKETEIKTETKTNGMAVIDYAWKGTDKEGDTRISLSVFYINNDRILLALYWASPSGEKDNAKDLKAIYAGIKPTGVVLVQ